MPRWTFCPQCDAELFIPDGMDDGAWAQCPDCSATFEVGNLAIRPLVEVTLVDGPPAPRDEPTAAADSTHEQRTVTLADLMPPVETSGESPQHSAEPSPALQSDLRETLPFSTGSMPTTGDADFKFDDSGPELGGFSPEVAEPIGRYAEPSLPGAGWSDGTDEAESWSAGADNSPAGIPTADIVSGDPPNTTGREADDAEAVSVSPSPRRRRRRSPLRTMVGVALGGVVGLACGYYVLLLLGGPDTDVLELARYLPERWLPKSFQSQSDIATATPMPPAQSMLSQLPAAPQYDSATTRPDVPRPSAERTAEVPASFAAPIESPADPATMADDGRYALDDAAGEVAPVGLLPSEPLASIPTEPSRFDDPAALPLSAIEPRVTDAPSYTADQVLAALAAARQAKTKLVKGSLDNPQVRGAKAFGYTRFCELAEALTYAKNEPDSDALAQLGQQAEKLFAATLAGERTRSEVVRIAAIWVNSPNRRSDGVLLTGQLVGRSTLGNVDECQLDVGEGVRITALIPSQQADDLELGAKLGIVGTIIDEPGQRVSGYTGGAPQAVWVGRVLRLP